MSNELNLTYPTGGLTITGRVYSFAGVQQGSDVAMSEVVAKQYSGTFDVSALADGEYPVHFDTATATIGSGVIYVRSGTEIIQENFATLPDLIVGANA